MAKFEYEIALSSGEKAFVYAADFHEAMEKALRVANESTEDERIEEIKALF